jgi:hypothetical protein
MDYNILSFMSNFESFYTFGKAFIMMKNVESNNASSPKFSKLP